MPGGTLPVQRGHLLRVLEPLQLLVPRLTTAVEELDD